MLRLTGLIAVFVLVLGGTPSAFAQANGNGNGPPEHSNAGGNGNGPPEHSNAGGNGGAGPPEHSNAGGNGASGNSNGNNAGISGSSAAPSGASERTAIDAVQSGRAMPLAKILPQAEAAGHGQMIDAELVTVQGFLLYAIKLLTPEGRVETRYFYAQSGLPVRGQ